MPFSFLEASMGAALSCCSAGWPVTPRFVKRNSQNSSKPLKIYQNPWNPSIFNDSLGSVLECDTKSWCLGGPYLRQKMKRTCNVGPKPFVHIRNDLESVQNTSGVRISRPYVSCGHPQLFPRICIAFVLKKRQIYMVWQRFCLSKHHTIFNSPWRLRTWSSL